MATDAVLAVIRASRPSFRNPYDKIAFAVHSCFLAAGYSLTATGSQAEEATQPSSSGNEEVGIEGWNQLEESYAFCYIKSEKGETKYVIVKCLIMGDLLIVDAVLLGAKGNPEPFNLEINVKDYTNESAVRNNYAEQYKDFPSLVEKINSGIVSSLENLLEKGSASANSRLSVTNGEVQGSAESQPGFGVSVHQPDSSGLIYPPVPTVGGSDVFPGPVAGIYPRRGGNGMGGGMLLGPNDRHWGNIGIVGDEGPFFRGEVRGVPPGARFDPFGPPGVPGFEPNRFIRDQRRPPGRGTHPDLEHFSPY